MCEALRELFADDLHESELKGRTAGKIEGKIEGAASKMIELVIKKYQKGCTVEETSDMLEESPNIIKPIYDAIQKCAPDYNVEKIYRELADKNTLK